MPNYPTSLPSATPATHGEVVDEIRAIAGYAPNRHPLYVSSFWYQVPQCITQASQTHVTGTLALTPMWLPFGTLISALGEWCVTAGTAGAVRRLGIYSDNGSYYPGALLVEAGTYDATVTGFRSINLGSNVDVGGLNWIGGVSQTATSTFTGVANNIPGISGGSGTPPTGTNAMCGYMQTGVTGALPANFTSTVTTINGSSKTYLKIA